MRVALDLREINRRSGVNANNGAVASANNAVQNNASNSNIGRPRTSPMTRSPPVDQDRQSYPSLLLMGTKAAFPEEGKHDEEIHTKRKPPKILPINKTTIRPLTASAASTGPAPPLVMNASRADTVDNSTVSDLQQPSIISESSISISSRKKSKLNPIKSSSHSEKRPVSANPVLSTSSSQPAVSTNIPFQPTTLNRLPEGRGSSIFSDELSEVEVTQVGLAEGSYDSMPHSLPLTVNTNITPQIQAPSVQPVSPHATAKSLAANTSSKSANQRGSSSRRMSISFKPVVEEPLKPTTPSTPSAFAAAMRNDPELVELLSPMVKRHQQIKFFWDIWFKKHVKELQTMNLSPTQIELLCQLDNSLTKAKYQHFVEIEEAAIKQQEENLPINEELMKEMKEKITAAALAAGVALKSAAGNTRKSSMNPSMKSSARTTSFGIASSSPIPYSQQTQQQSQNLLPNIPPEAIAMVSDERITKELDSLHHYTPAYIHYIRNVASSALEILDTLINEIGRDYPLLSDIKEVLLPMIFEDLKETVKVESSENESDVTKEQQPQEKSSHVDGMTFVEKWYGMTRQLQEQLLHYQHLYHDHQSLQYKHDTFMLRYDVMEERLLQLEEAHKEALHELSNATDRCTRQDEMILHQKETISTLQYNYSNVKQSEEYLTKESSSLTSQLRETSLQKTILEQRLIEQVKQHEKISQDYFAMKARQQEIQQMNKNLHNEIKILKNDSAKAHEYYQNILNQLVDQFVGYVKTHGGFIPSLQSTSMDYTAGGPSSSMRRASSAASSSMIPGRGIAAGGHEPTVMEQSLDDTDAALLVDDDGSIPIDPSMDDSDQVSGLPSITMNSPLGGTLSGGNNNGNTSGKLLKLASMFATGVSGKASSISSAASSSSSSNMLNAVQQLTSNSRPGSGSRSTPLSGSRPGSAIGHRSTLAVIPNSATASPNTISSKHISPNHRVLTMQVAGIDIQLNGPTPTVDAFMKTLQSAVPQKAFELKYYEENNLKYDLITNNIQVFYSGMCTSLTQCAYWRKHSEDITISMHQQKLSYEEHIQQVKAQNMEESLKAQASFEEIRKELKQQIYKRDIDIVGYKQLVATKDFQILEKEDAYRVMSDHYDRYKAHTDASLELWRSRTRMLTADGWLGERVDRLEQTKKLLANEIDETNKVVQHQQETIQDLHVQMDELRELHEIALKRLNDLHEQEKENIHTQWTEQHQSMITKYDKQLHETNTQYQEILQKYEEMIAAIPVVIEGECQTDTTFITPGEVEIQTDKSYLQTQLQRAQSSSKHRRNHHSHRKRRGKYSKQTKIEIDYVPRERRPGSSRGNSGKHRTGSASGKIMNITLDGSAAASDYIIPEDGYAAIGEDGVQVIDLEDDQDHRLHGGSLDTGTVTTDSYVTEDDDDTFDDEYDDEEEEEYDEEDEDEEGGERGGEESELSSLDASEHRKTRRHSKRGKRRSKHSRTRGKGRRKAPRKPSQPSTFYDETNYKPVVLNPFSNPQALEYFLDRFKQEKSKIQSCKDALQQLKNKVSKDLQTFSKLFTQLIAIVPKEIDENQEALQNINVYSMVSREITRRASMAGSSISMHTVKNFLPPNLILPGKHRSSIVGNSIMTATSDLTFRSPSNDAGTWHVNDPTHPHFHNPFAQAAAAAVDAVNGPTNASKLGMIETSPGSLDGSQEAEIVSSPLPLIQQGISNMEHIIQTMDTKEFLAVTKQFSEQFAQLAGANGKVATRTSYVLSGNQFKPFVEKIKIVREVDPEGEVKMKRQQELRMYSNSKHFTTGTQTTSELLDTYIQETVGASSLAMIRRSRSRSPKHGHGRSQQRSVSSPHAQSSEGDGVMASRKPFSGQSQTSSLRATSQDRLSTASPYAYLYASHEDTMEEDYEYMKSYWQSHDVFDRPKVRTKHAHTGGSDEDSEEDWEESQLRQEDSLLSSRVDSMTAQDLIYKYPAKLLSQPFLGYVRKHEKQYAREVALMQIALREYKTYHMQLLEDIASLISNKIVQQGNGNNSNGIGIGIGNVSPNMSNKASSLNASPLNSPPKLQKQASQRLVRQLTQKFSAGNFTGKMRKMNTGKVPWKYSQILSYIQSSLKQHTWMFDPKLFIREMSKRQAHHHEATLYSTGTGTGIGGSGGSGILTGGSLSVDGTGTEYAPFGNPHALIHDSVDVATQGKIITSYQDILYRYKVFLQHADDYLTNMTLTSGNISGNTGIHGVTGANGNGNSGGNSLPTPQEEVEAQQRMIVALQDTTEDLVTDLTRRMCESGGWRSLLYGKNGIVDLDMEITPFPYPEQVAIVQEKLAFVQYTSLQQTHTQKKITVALQQRILSLEKQNTHLRQVLHCHLPGQHVGMLSAGEDAERAGRDGVVPQSSPPSRRKSVFVGTGAGISVGTGVGTVGIGVGNVGISVGGVGSGVGHVLGPGNVFAESGSIFGEEPLLLVAQALDEEESEDEEIFTVEKSTVTEEDLFPEASMTCLDKCQTNTAVELQPIRTLIRQIQEELQTVLSHQTKTHHHLALLQSQLPVSQMVPTTPSTSYHPFLTTQSVVQDPNSPYFIPQSIQQSIQQQSIQQSIQQNIQQSIQQNIQQQSIQQHSIQQSIIQQGIPGSIPVKTSGNSMVKVPPILYPNTGNSATNASLAYVPIPTNPPSLLIPVGGTGNNMSGKYQPVLTASTGSHLRYTPANTTTITPPTTTITGKSNPVTGKKPWSTLAWRQYEKTHVPPSDTSGHIPGHFSGHPLSEVLTIHPAPVTTIRALGSNLVSDSSHSMSDHNLTYDQHLTRHPPTSGHPPVVSPTTVLLLRELLSLEDTLLAYWAAPVYYPTPYQSYQPLSQPYQQPYQPLSQPSVIGIGEAGLHEETPINTPINTQMTTTSVVVTNTPTTTTTGTGTGGGMVGFADDDDEEEGEEDSNLVPSVALRIYTDSQIQSQINSQIQSQMNSQIQSQLHTQGIPGITSMTGNTDMTQPVSPLPAPKTTHHLHQSFPLSHPMSTRHPTIAGNVPGSVQGSVQGMDTSVRAGSYNKYAEQLTGQSSETRLYDALYARIRQQHVLDHPVIPNPYLGTTIDTGTGTGCSAIPSSPTSPAGIAGAGGVVGGVGGSVLHSADGRDMMHYAKTIQSQYEHHKEKMQCLEHILCTLQAEHGLPLQPPPSSMMSSSSRHPSHVLEGVLDMQGVQTISSAKTGKKKGMRGTRSTTTTSTTTVAAQSHYENPLVASTIARDATQIVTPALYTVDTRNTWQ